MAKEQPTTSEIVDMHLPNLIAAAFEAGRKAGAAQSGAKAVMLMRGHKGLLTRSGREIWRGVMGRYPTAAELRDSLGQVAR